MATKYRIVSDSLPINVDADGYDTRQAADMQAEAALGEGAAYQIVEYALDALDAKIEERGNGFPRPGQYVATDGDLYRVVELTGPIETTGVRGNWMRAKVEEADWSDCAEGDEFPAAVVLGSF